MKKRTKIVCTIGPASSDKKTLEKMVRAGLDVARINFSHGSWESNGRLVKEVRATAEKVGNPIAVMADLQGPRIRLGELPPAGVILKRGEKVILDSSRDFLKDKKIPVNYGDLGKDLKVGQRILLDDGKIELVVKKIKGPTLEAEAATGGVLISHKGINLPDSTVSLGALTEKDKKDLEFVLASGFFDFIAFSFVKEAKDILDLRYFIRNRLSSGKGFQGQAEEIKIIAKIERHEAVKNIKEIISATDGIMVARGDLGLEIPAENVPLLQKEIISQCLGAAKPVIVATQMLESMTHNPRPTRAEVSDVANAVIDHADAVMLSGETANGEYPVEAVETMNRIIAKTEKSIFDDIFSSHVFNDTKETDVIVSGLAKLLAEKTKAKAILGASLSGETGRQISRFRPELPIFIATSSPKVRNQLNLSWGVHSFILSPCQTVEELIERSLVYLKKNKLVKFADKIIIIAGEPVGHAGYVNLIEIKEVK